MPTIAQTADTEKRCRVQGTGRGILYTSGAGPVTHSFRLPVLGQLLRVRAVRDLQLNGLPLVLFIAAGRLCRSRRHLYCLCAGMSSASCTFWSLCSLVQSSFKAGATFAGLAAPVPRVGPSGTGRERIRDPFTPPC